MLPRIPKGMNTKFLPVAVLMPPAALWWTISEYGILISVRVLRIKCSWEGLLSMLNHYLISFLISMVPLVELRGALPYALATGIPTLPAYLICTIGNMLPVPVIFFFARKVLEWGADKKYIGPFFTWCLQKGHKGGEKLKSKASNRGLFFALLLFVGIPLPGTGAWTGTLAASILDMDFKTSVLAVMLGVILASIIMGVGSLLVINGVQMIG